MPLISELEGIVCGPGEGESLSDARLYLVKGGLPDLTFFAVHAPFVSAPPGVAHTFGKPGPGYARLLNVHAPDAGFAERLRGSGVGSTEPPESGGAGFAGAGAGSG